MKIRLLAATLLFGFAVVRAAERPNIIFLLTDGQSIGAAGCDGNWEVITPNLDQLARDGGSGLPSQDQPLEEQQERQGEVV